MPVARRIVSGVFQIVLRTDFDHVHLHVQAGAFTLELLRSSSVQRSAASVEPYAWSTFGHSEE